MIHLPLLINKDTNLDDLSQNKSPKKIKKELPKKVVEELKKVIRKSANKDTEKETNKDSVGNKPVKKSKKSPTRELLKKIIFKTLEECESSKRTQPYYMSKEELIKHIQSDPELLLKFGKNITALKKLSKKDLCAQIPL
jgi:glucan phosphorylase